MTIENLSSTNSTTTTGVIITTALFGFAAMTNPVSIEKKIEANKALYYDYKGQIRPWEYKLLGAENSGGEVLQNTDAGQFASLAVFATKLIQESVQPPKEFEKTFRKRFRDILA